MNPISSQTGPLAVLNDVALLRLVAERRPERWMRDWLRSPEHMLATDDTAKALLRRFNGVPMPNQNLTDDQIEELIRYLRWAKDQPAPQAAHE